MDNLHVGDFDAYWAEMDPTESGHPYDEDGHLTGQEPTYLHGHVVEIVDQCHVRVRSSITNRLYDVFMDDNGVTLECVEYERGKRNK